MRTRDLIDWRAWRARAILLLTGLTIAFAMYSAAVFAQDQPADITLTSLLAQGYEVRGMSMPDHHAVNFVLQKATVVYWCAGTNFAQALIGKVGAIETQCTPVK